jgi:hypothetical protein
LSSTPSKTNSIGAGGRHDRPLHRQLYEPASSTADVQAEVERRIAAGEIIGAADVARL